MNNEKKTTATIWIHCQKIFHDDMKKKPKKKKHREITANVFGLMPHYLAGHCKYILTNVAGTKRVFFVCVHFR